ncbi:MAG: cation-translocating P-type ATPase [Lachnospiraceae bacterium]|nr:cation-translocating P-type ATPase [Lachnospiraceae bacterium]
MFEKQRIEEVIRQLQSHGEKGLTEAEAAVRLKRDGKNEMKEVQKKTLLDSFFEQLNDPLIYVLIGAAAVSVMLKEVSDAVIIGVVVFMNAIVGMVQEGKAQKALDSLKKLTSPKAVVIREGVKREVPAAELVVGDLVCLEAGCQVPADMRLIRTNHLKVEESSLTGESLPVEKSEAFVAKGNVPLGDRQNMVYMSTIVTYGRGEGIVTDTGMQTQIGQIAGMITDSKEEMTPLQKRLGELGTLLSVLSLLLCGALFLIAVVQKRDILKMLLTAISLAVAAVPEGLPAVVTICLALSVTRMVRVNTIVRRLPSVETLGAVSVVCSDKTGTLTQNKMTVEVCCINGKEYSCGHGIAKPADAGELLQGLVLCNDAVMNANSRLGDPTELALLDLASSYGIQKKELEKQMPRMAELSFDSDRKMMSTRHRIPGGTTVTYTKGAPERVLSICTAIRYQGRVIPMTEAHRRKIFAQVEKLSGQALRTLALAVKEEGGSKKTITEENLTFIGMVGMKDPPRPEAAEAVQIFREAGVSTVMITGDHVDTACAIGRQLGIVERSEQCMTGEELEHTNPGELSNRLEEVRVFARVSPAQKVQIVKSFREKGHIVAMTGDGVNDAPSLKAADIGIAMGVNGTDVAKQASDMILTDDNFATIEKAIEEGRSVYENIRKSVIFLLSSNLGEIMTMFIAVILGMASPLKSSHILWINLITDSLPALALGVDHNDTKSLMRNSPRKPGESLFARGGLACTCFYGVLITCASLTAFLMLPMGILQSRGMEVGLPALIKLLEQEAVLAKAQTYAFTVLGMSQLFHAVGMRDAQKSVFRMNHMENKLMILACILGFALQFAVTEVPFLIGAFGTSHLSGREWMNLTMLAASPMAAHEIAVIVGKLGKGRT